MFVDSPIDQKYLPHYLLQIYRHILIELVFNRALNLKFLLSQLSDNAVLKLLHLVQLALHLLAQHLVLAGLQELKVLLNLRSELLQVLVGNQCMRRILNASQMTLLVFQKGVVVYEGTNVR